MPKAVRALANAPCGRFSGNGIGCRGRPGKYLAAARSDLCIWLDPRHRGVVGVLLAVAFGQRCVLTSAFQLMAALEKAQRGLEAHRRRLAREHAQLPGPSPPSPSPPRPRLLSRPRKGQRSPSPLSPPGRLSVFSRLGLQPALHGLPLSRPHASRPRFSWRGLLRALRSGKKTR